MSAFDVIVEDVPPFVKRNGDIVMQGSNNTAIILGTDRTKDGVASVEDGLGHTKASNNGKQAGSYHVVVGRNDKDGNLDFEKDKAYEMISMKSNVDATLKSTFETNQSESSCVISKADCQRVNARKDIKIFIDNDSYIFLNDEKWIININGVAKITASKDGKVVIDAGKIELGAGASESVILGDTFIKEYMAHTHISPAGSTSTPIPVPQPSAYLSDRSKVNKK
jgi:hypothetical protein